MLIEIDVADPYLELVPRERLQAAIAAVLDHEGSEGDITLMVSDDDTIADLNKRFLGIDGPTDVLSFPSQTPEQDFAEAPDTDPYLGDIIIAFPYTAEQARRNNTALGDELVLLAIHGTLHLLGYDHAEPEEKAVMWAKQDAILSGLLQR